MSPLVPHQWQASVVGAGCSRDGDAGRVCVEDGGWKQNGGAPERAPACAAGRDLGYGQPVQPV